jgi:SpoIID/LytB domain protein
MQEPIITAGILGAKDSSFRLNGEFQKELCPDGSVRYTPLSEDASFTLPAVKIGIGFHWERLESQTFRGALHIYPDGLLINEVALEEYLRSVISSEMNASAPYEFLKVHAIVSRSWLMAMLTKKPTNHEQGEISFNSEYHCNEIHRWYDRDAHTRFDVCTDDHCQRYQGITRQVSPNIAKAIEETRGIVLAYNGEVCDARFSKCCGGLTEEYSAAWEDRDIPYLQSIADLDSSGRCYCATAKPELLVTIVNNYDLDSPDISQWTETLTQQKIRTLVLQHTGYNLGNILELRPLERGKSGRITRLLIRGNNDSLIIGKELEIRRVLSDSHLKSSDFTVTTIYPTSAGDGENVPEKFILTGKGWGHGVGMCQIGAAVMASEGVGYEAILKHYFTNAEIIKLYP